MKGKLSRPTLLVINGGIEALPGIQTAKRMDLNVVVSDRNEQAPAAQLADGFLQASTYDVRQTIEAALQYHRCCRPIDGVISIAADVPKTVAGVAEALQLPSLSNRTATIASDKLLMKETLSTHGVPVPWFEAVDSAKQLERLRCSQKQQLIVKPVDSRGSRGVVMLKSNVDSCWAYEQAHTISPSGRVMVEEFLTGPQVSTESLVIDGSVVTLGFVDRNYALLDHFAPYVIENGGSSPSILSDTVKEATDAIIQKSCNALELHHGTIKGDIVVSHGIPFVIEVAPRLSGGFLATHQIPLATGVDFVAHAIRIALGQSICAEELRPKHRQAVVRRDRFSEKNGILVSIENIDAARSIPGVIDIIQLVDDGYVVGLPQDANGALITAICVGKTAHHAVERADKALQTLCIEIDASQH